VDKTGLNVVSAGIRFVSEWHGFRVCRTPVSVVARQHEGTTAPPVAWDRVRVPLASVGR
jgi:hypothetical protein